MAKAPLGLVLLCFVFCALASPLSSTITQREKRGDELHLLRDWIDSTTYELVGGVVSGYVSPARETVYIINFAAGEVGDFMINFGDSNMASSTTMSFFNGGDYNPLIRTGNLNIVISEHCPEVPSKYYIVFKSTIAATFDAQFYKRQVTSLTPTIGVTYGGVISPLRFGYIAIPVAQGQCQKLVVHVELSQQLYNSFTYMCRYYSDSPTELCQRAGVPVQALYSAGSAAKPTYQYIINCTEQGNYYLRMQSNSAFSYNVTFYNNYPCPTGCWEGGICDYSTSKCVCNPGHDWGLSCGVPPINYPLARFIDLSTNGSATIVTSDNIKDVANQLRLLTSAADPDAYIRLTFVANNPTNQFMYLDLLFKPETAIYGDNWVSSNSLMGYASNSITVVLNAKYTAWYIDFNARSVFQPDLSVYATVVTGITTTGSFAENTISSSYPSTFSIPVVYRFVSTSVDQAVHIQQNIEGIQGVVVYSGNFNVISDPSSAYYTSDQIAGSDVGYTYVNYQAQTQVAAGKDFYFAVFGDVGASYFGSIDVSPKANCSYLNWCTSKKNGYCTAEGSCRCRRGWIGNKCEQIDPVANTAVLLHEEQYTFTFDWSKNFYENTKYLATSVLPAGTRVNGLFVSQTRAWWVASTQRAVIAYPKELIDLEIQQSSVAVWRPDKCATHTEARYYAALSPVPTAIISGNIQLQVNFTSAILPNGPGTSSQLVFEAGTIVPFVTFLPSNCATAYKIIVNAISGTFGYVSVGTGPYCFARSQDMVYENSTYSTIITVANCNEPIDLEFAPTTYVQAQVSIVPVSGCPNGCYQRGQCTDSGVCHCDYPYTGDDCSAYDALCAILPNNFACQTNQRTSYKNLLDGSIYESYCSVQYASYSVPSDVDLIRAVVGYQNINLTQNCLDELAEILCDATKLKCQSQPGGGVKLLAPCNCKSWQTRCAPAYYGPLYELDNACKSVDSTMMASPGLVICDPNPFTPTTTTSGAINVGSTGSVTSVSGSTSGSGSGSTSSSGSSTSSGATSGSGSTSGSSSATTTNASPTSAASSSQATTQPQGTSAKPATSTNSATTKSASTGSPGSSTTTGDTNVSVASKHSILVHTILFVAMLSCFFVN